MKSRMEKMEQIIEVLYQSGCSANAPLQEKLSNIAPLYSQYSVRVLCEALKVDRGTFYNHIFRNKKENNSYQKRRDDLSQKILNVFNANHQVFAAKKIKVILQDEGVTVSVKLVGELMDEMNLSSVRNDAKKNYKKFNKGENMDRLKLDFTAEAPNQVWVSDITYFKYKDKKLYICVILELYSRRVVSYKISERPSTQNVTSSLKQAYNSREIQKQLIFHSDRGSQYISHTFRTLLNAYNITQSLSPAGKPRHNAVMESFFSTLKKEELYRMNYRSVAEFKTGIKNYVEFYNTKRPHATLGYKTPAYWEEAYYKRSNKS